MSRSLKIILAVLIFGIGAIYLAENHEALFFVRTSIPGRVVRWFLGEPGFTQWVNDTADKITDRKETSELQTLADRLMLEFGPASKTLPRAPFMGTGDGRSLPLSRLPLKFRQLGGFYGNDAELILQIDEKGAPIAVIVRWGHGRECIEIYPEPPRIAPTGFAPSGFFVRKLTDRIFVEG